ARRDPGAGHPGRDHQLRRRRPLRQPAAAVRHRCRDRFREEGRRLHRARRRRRLPGALRVMWAITGQEAGTAYNEGPYGVLGGIIAGLTTAWLWQRYHRLKLPAYLAFFGGRRFVPIITAVTMLVIGVVLGLLYPL